MPNYLLSPEAPYAIFLAFISLAVAFRSLKTWRKSLINTSVFFLACLLGDLIAGLLEEFHSGNGLLNTAKLLRELAIYGEGMAVIRFAGLALFRVTLPAMKLSVSGILADILIIIGYIGWAFIRLNLAGIELTHLFATSAVLTAVLAFSMQDTLGNLLGGLALQMDNSLEIGNWIKIDDLSGHVTDIQWRHTSLKTRNGETVVVPNSQLMKGRYFVICHPDSDPPFWRRHVTFNVDLSFPPAKVIAIATEAIQTAQIDNTAPAPAPTCILLEFGQGYAQYDMRYWLTNPQQDDFTDSNVRIHILAALQRAGMRLAVGDQTVHLVTEGSRHRQEVHQRELNKRLDAIGRVELFTLLSLQERTMLAEKLVAAPFAKGDVMTHQGAVAHWLYIIISGEAEAWWQPPEGPKRLHEKRGPGSVFGELGLMTGAPRRATVLATSDVEAYRLDKNGFEQIIRARPELAASFSDILQRRLAYFDALEKGYADNLGTQIRTGESGDLGQKILEFFGLNLSS
ncbi:MAG: hypothetical protein RIR18_2146 [Pseudomonadota bacterium]|jgi:small-conductance mechanosensitive channel